VSKSKFDGFKLAEGVLSDLHGYITAKGLVGVPPAHIEQFTELFKTYYVVKDQYGPESEDKDGSKDSSETDTPEPVIPPPAPSPLPDEDASSDEWDNVKVGGTD
jgi:hypothetical protein